MQVTKFPVFSMLGQALVALFRARTHLHPVTALVFLTAAAVMAAVLFSVVGKSSVEIFVALTKLNLFVLPVLVVFVFWLYRRYRLRPLGATRPIVSFLQMVLFAVMLVIIASSFTLLGGVIVFAGAVLLGVNANAPISMQENILLLSLAAPAIFAGSLLCIRLLPGMALAARGEGFDIPRAWGVLRGNYWRFFATMLLFNVLVNMVLVFVDNFISIYGQEVAITRDFNAPAFYALLLAAVVIHMWNVAGVAFLTSRACDMLSVDATPVKATVAEPVVVAAKPAKTVAAKKPVAKPAAKKAAAKKPAAKKPAAKKEVAKKVVAKKVVAKKAAVKKPAAKKAVKTKK